MSSPVTRRQVSATRANDGGPGSRPTGAPYSCTMTRVTPPGPRAEMASPPG